MGGLAAAAAKAFEIGPALIPEDRHQGENEVGLIEADAFAVNSNEDVGDLFLVNGGRDFERGKWVFLEVEEAIQVVANEFLCLLVH